MQEGYLEVTFRHGRAIAAYYYLPGRRGRKSYKTVRAGIGILVDYSRSGEPIGLEFTAPSKVSLVGVNRVLRELGIESIGRAEFAPLLAA